MALRSNYKLELEVENHLIFVHRKKIMVLFWEKFRVKSSHFFSSPMSFHFNYINMQLVSIPITTNYRSFP